MLVPRFYPIVLRNYHLMLHMPLGVPHYVSSVALESSSATHLCCSHTYFLPSFHLSHPQKHSDCILPISQWPTNQLSLLELGDSSELSSRARPSPYSAPGTNDRPPTMLSSSQEFHQQVDALGVDRDNNTQHVAKRQEQWLVIFCMGS